MITWTVGSGGNFASIADAMASGSVVAGDTIEFIGNYGGENATVTIAGLTFTNAPNTSDIGTGLTLGAGIDTLTLGTVQQPIAVTGNADSDTLTVQGTADADTTFVTVSGDVITQINYGTITGIEHVTLDLRGQTGDTLDYGTNTSQAVVVDLAAGTATGFDSIAGVQQVNAGSGDDTLTGGTGTSYLFGRGGDDILTAGTGGGFLSGDAGNDTLDASASLVGMSLQGGAGADMLTGSAFKDFLFDNAGVASDGADDTLNGGDGDDQITSYGGADAIDGGAGTDTAQIDRSGATAALTFDETDIDTVTTLVGDGTTVIHVENINLFGGGGDDQFSVASGSNHLVGGGGDDTLTGGSGVDTLDGGIGADTLTLGAGGTANGGAGSDTISGGSTFTSNLNGDAGDDQITGGAAFSTLDGGDGKDTLTAGAGGDSMTGDAGDDTLDATAETSGSTLDGGTGNDTLIGGDLNDTLVDGPTGDNGSDTLSAGADADS
ncbi:MAG TPA: calcium-binding protein, partial [Thermomicrobiales bacterium]|nr:calcium-binding protein [Thermomicrobiales bacterium]